MIRRFVQHSTRIKRPLDLESIRQIQKTPCDQHNIVYQPLDFHLELGISANFFDGTMPLNGLRLKPESDTCGWYLWAGEDLSQADNFFQAMHVYHLVEHQSSVLQYLALPPGWRFLTNGIYEDIWFDATLLEQ